MQKTNKNYISTIDQYLAEFDQTHAFSETQQAEINKYQRIYRLRDNPTTDNQSPSSIWD